MQCRTHPTISAANTCNHCGDWLCDDCMVNVQGRTFCRPCLATLSQDHGAEASPPPAAPGYSKVSLGVLFFFSFLPGANYMYMGLMKRGLATMTGFFLLFFLIAQTSMPLTLLMIFGLIVLFFASFFDGFNVRRRLNAGEPVRDDIGELLNSILANKFLRTLFLVAIAVSIIVSVLQITVAIISRLLPLIVIALIVFIIIKGRPPNKPPGA